MRQTQVDGQEVLGVMELLAQHPGISTRDIEEALKGRTKRVPTARELDSLVQHGTISRDEARALLGLPKVWPWWVQAIRGLWLIVWPVIERCTRTVWRRLRFESDKRISNRWR